MESVTCHTRPALIVEEVIVAEIVALYWLQKKKEKKVYYRNDVYSLRLPKFEITQRRSPGLPEVGRSRA